MLVCFFAYSYTVHSVDQAIQLFTPGCHRYLLLKKKVKEEHSRFCRIDRLLHSFFVTLRQEQSV